MSPRDMQVKVMLSAEEYIALRALAEHVGVSQSSLLRMMAKDKIREHALNMAPPDETATDKKDQD
jgi:hypothetical protein